MRSAVGILFASGLFALPAMAQTPPPTPQELQQQSDQDLQNQRNAVSQSQDQQQSQIIEDQQRRDQLFAIQPPVQPLPIYKLPPPLPPPAYKPPPPPKAP